MPLHVLRLFGHTVCDARAVAVAPDYEIQSDSVVMLMAGEVYRPSAYQRTDVIWRNIFVNKRNMVLTATCLEGVKYNSLEILNYPNTH
ncbi:MAG: hypothetical protein ACI4BD_05735 [Paludibacteraceae bacterium]